MSINGVAELQPDWLLAGQRVAATLPDGAQCASLAAFLAESGSLAPQLMLSALLRSGFSTDAGWQIAEQSRALRLDPCFTPLLARWHQQLEEEGWLEQDGAEWRLAQCAPGLAALEQRIDDTRHRLRQLVSWLDDGTVLATALLNDPDQLDSWLAAPLLVPQAQAGLDRLLHLPGMLSRWFSDIVAAITPLLLADVAPPAGGQGGPQLLSGCRHTLPFTQALSVQAVPVDLQQPLADHLPPHARYHGLMTSGLFSHPAAIPLLQSLQPYLHPGAALLLLENVAERPLHWVTPAALQAQAAGETGCPFSAASDLEQCRETLQQAGFQLQACWPQPDTPMAFCGQRLLVARRMPTP